MRKSFAWSTMMWFAPAALALLVAGCAPLRLARPWWWPRPATRPAPRGAAVLDERLALTIEPTRFGGSVTLDPTRPPPAPAAEPDAYDRGPREQRVVAASEVATAAKEEAATVAGESGTPPPPPPPPPPPKTGLHTLATPTRILGAKTTGRLADLMAAPGCRGRSTVVVAWMTTWCPICVEELPALAQLARRHANACVAPVALGEIDRLQAVTLRRKLGRARPPFAAAAIQRGCADAPDGAKCETDLDVVRRAVGSDGYAVPAFSVFGADGGLLHHQEAAVWASRHAGRDEQKSAAVRRRRLEDALRRLAGSSPSSKR